MPPLPELAPEPVPHAEEVSGRTGPAGGAEGRRRLRRRRLAGLVISVALLLVTVVLSIAVGSRSVPIGHVWDVLWTNDGSPEAVIVHDLRIPRTLLGILVGVSLGLAGGLMQALTLNPLAEPGLMGVNTGASFAVVCAIAFLGVSSFGGYVWFAFAGAAITATAVFALGSTGRSPTPERQVLAGVAITAVLGAFIWGVLVWRHDVFNRYRFWDVGSIAERDMGTVWQVLPFVAVGVVLALALGRSLDALALGAETGAALGANVRRTQALGMLAMTILCGAATAAAGPIWFVGLAVPYAARLITGPELRWVLAYSLVLAPVLMLAADVVGRVVVRPGELGVGIVTAFVGAPVFLAIARRRRIGSL